MENIDTKQINSLVDVRDLAGRLVELRKEKSNGAELSGPCPKCGGADRFHCTAEWWFCRQCHEKFGDAIELVQWLGLAHGFRDAVDYLQRLAGGSAVVDAVEKRQPARAHGAASWKAPTWQSEARDMVTKACWRLAEAPEGEPGRAYLAGRGLAPETWQAWQVGFASAWHPARQKQAPAVILPWQRSGTVKALQYRFIGQDIGPGERFGQKAGGERTLYGADQLAGREVLVLVEGELNALSVWQVARQWVDVLSFGSESNAGAVQRLRSLAGRYAGLVVWADKPDVASTTSTAVEGWKIPAVALQSPGGLDANDLLQRQALAGFLGEIASELAGRTYRTYTASQTDEALARYRRCDDCWAGLLGLPALS